MLNRTDVHLHFPEGAVSKDGPSSGVAIVTALTSLLTGRLVRNDVAMTGEVTLRGLVLPVGGVKEKVIGAHRAGVRMCILPARNEKDLLELPASVAAEMDFTFVTDVEQALEVLANIVNQRLELFWCASVEQLRERLPHRSRWRRVVQQTPHLAKQRSAVGILGALLFIDPDLLAIQCREEVFFTNDREPQQQGGVVRRALRLLADDEAADLAAQ